ncbi:MAG: CTP-dependent riboflavin kinase [Candidatus Micrarchaeota archaeon]|nr:CTP-dependent riboflavin kinase [Candidatus Micrarchaeota archaeon]MDE1824134.1 CTP-dependent riboflavin kinase [Candidatus Micrarchaeota archaeon]MDE1849907.1 CTP-dependent riboflavin kinase [Candidatus Micrarchaeota archaeon]
MKKDGNIEISGTVITGIGMGVYFMSQKGYIDQIAEKLSFNPYPGTFNIRITEDDMGAFAELRKSKGTLIKGFEADGKTFGDVIAHRAEIRGFGCAVVIPKLSKHKDIIEVIADRNLRKMFDLSDGSFVTIKVYVDIK